MNQPTLADGFAADAPWTVYECIALDGMVLYVGMTGRGGARLAEHAGKPWWTAVETIYMWHYTTQESAREAEADMIRRLRPLFNTAGRPSGPPRVIQTAYDMTNELDALRTQVARLEARLGELVI